MKRVSRKISAIYTGFLLLIFAGVSILLLRIQFLHYEELISWIVVQLKKPELDGLLRNRALTYAKFRLLQKTALAGLILLPFCFIFLYAGRKLFIPWILYILQTICGAFSSLAGLFRRHSKTEKISFFTVLFLIFGRSVFYIISRDLQYDEMWSYNYYSASPFYFSFFMYNNYPLYEISTHLFTWLPFPGKINIRLPVLMAGLMACSLFYFYLYAHFKKHIPALAGMILFAFLPPVTTYMLYGRGVIFELLFAIIAFFSLIRWLDSPDKNDQLLMFILANILGVYAMPSHIYFWICLVILAGICLKDKKQVFWKLGFANLAIAIGVLIAYLPVLLGSGISFLLDVLKPVLPIKAVWVNLPGYLGNLSNFFTGFSLGLALVFVTCLVMIRFKKTFAPHFQILLFCSIVCFLPVLTNFAQRVKTPFRALTFIALALPLLGAILFQVYGLRLSKKILYLVITLLILTCAAVTDQNPGLNWSRKRDKQVLELSRFLLGRGITSCYDNSLGSSFKYYYPGLEYYYRQAGKTFYLTLNDPRSLRFKPYSTGDHYDCLVSDRDSFPDPSTGKYRLIYHQPEEKFNVFSGQ